MKCVNNHLLTLDPLGNIFISTYLWCFDDIHSNLSMKIDNLTKSVQVNIRVSKVLQLQKSRPKTYYFTWLHLYGRIQPALGSILWYELRREYNSMNKIRKNQILVNSELVNCLLLLIMASVVNCHSIQQSTVKHNNFESLYVPCFKSFSKHR